MIYFPDHDLACGAAEAQSCSFFDVHNAPPWGTWVAMVEEAGTECRGPYLVAWVPPEFVPLAQNGINANPEQCIDWIENTEVILREAFMSGE